MRYTTRFALALTALLLSATAAAQVGVSIVPYSGDTQEIGLTPAGEIYFTTDRMIVATGGSNSHTYSFELGEVRKVTFSGTVSVRDVSQAAPIKLYPNPATQVVVADGLPEGTHAYTIYSSLGAAVQQGVCRNRQPINVGSLPQGVYLVRIGDSFTKLVKR